MQALGASGACHMGALFLKLNYAPWQAAGVDRRVYIPTESWSEPYPRPLLFARAPCINKYYRQGQEIFPTEPNDARLDD